MQHSANLQKLVVAAFLATSAMVLIAGAIWGIRFFMTRQAQTNLQTANMAIGGFPLSGSLAPDFTLTDQFNHRVTLSGLHGQEVVLAFIDSRCTTLCPLTSNIMYSAKAQLSAAQVGHVVLLAVNANPAATSVSTVEAWSIAHGMLHQWSFLTGSSAQLEAIYHAYNVFVQVDASGNAEHDPITFIIDAQGHERLSYETLASNDKLDLQDQEDGLADGMRQWLPHM